MVGEPRFEYAVIMLREPPLPAGGFREAHRLSHLPTLLKEFEIGDAADAKTPAVVPTLEQR
jgi:hypothetical protein